MAGNRQIRTSPKIPQGKLSKDLMNRFVYRNLGRSRSDVLLPPGRGLDNGVVRAARGTVMVVTADPVSVVPSLGVGLSAWLSVHLLASDIVTSGLSPQFAVFSFNFPSEIGEKGAADYLRAIGEECGRLGVAVVAGHTGAYGGSYPVVGGGAMWAFAVQGSWIDPTMSRPGDLVYMTKGAGIEAAAYLSLSFPMTTEERVGTRAAKRAAGMIRRCTVVPDGLVARKVGIGADGVTSMHDATEGGVLGGLAEMAAASGNRFVVDQEQVKAPPEADAVCRAFGLDPMETLSEGTLLLTCTHKARSRLESEMAAAHIPAFRIGHVAKGQGLSFKEEGRGWKPQTPGTEHYWSVYSEGVKKGWV